MENLNLSKTKSQSFATLKSNLKKYIIDFLDTRDRIIVSSILKYDFTYTPLNKHNPYLFEFNNENKSIDNKLKISFENSSFDKSELREFLQCYLRSSSQTYLNISSSYFKSKEDLKILQKIMNNKQIKEFYASNLSFSKELHNSLAENNINSKKNSSNLECENPSTFNIFKSEELVLEIIDFSNNFDLISIGNILKTCVSLNTLKELNIKSCNLNNFHLKLVKEILLNKSSNLVKLDISRNVIKYKGMEILSEGFKFNKTIEEIDISDNSLQDYGISVFFNALISNPFNKIKNLTSHNNNIIDGLTYKCFIDNEACHLEKLFLDEYLNPESCSCILKSLEKNKTIRELYVFFSDLYSNYIEEIASVIKNNTVLEKLYIQGNVSEDTSSNSHLLKEAIEINNKLKLLSLQNEFSHETLVNLIKGLRKNKTIEEIDISFNHRFNNTCLQETIEMLKINKTIKSFLICECNFSTSTNEFVELIAERRNIKYLDLSTNTIVDDCSEGLIKLFNSMTGNYIDEDNNQTQLTTADIKNEIVSLNLYKARLNELKVGTILGKNINHFNTSLKYLDLTDNYLDDDDIISICKSLETNFILETLLIGSNAFGLKGVLAIREMLKKNETLKLLDIIDSNLTVNEIDPLFEGMIYNKSVEILSIADSNLHEGNIVTVNFHKMLISNKKLRHFDFSNCMLSLDGVILLADGIEKNSTIKKIILSNIFNNEDLRMDFMKYLKPALIKNISIEAIRIDEFVSLTNVLDMFEVLENNKVIKIVEFSDNTSTKTGMTKLSELIKNNNSLKSLEVDINCTNLDIDKELEEFICNMLENSYLSNLEIHISGENYKEIREKIKEKENQYNFLLRCKNEFNFWNFFCWNKKFEENYL